MATLEYAVSNQEIATTKTAELVKNTIGFYTVKFTFTGSVWTGLSERWAVFDPDIGESYKTPLDGNGECSIPGEVMSANSLLIGVYGVTDGIEYPTIWTNRKWLKDGAYEDCPVSDYPEPSPVIETLQEEIDELTAGKVDKPENATEGNVAIFGSNSNIIDGGFKATEAFPVGSASDKTASFSDGANGVPIKEMTVQIEPIQAGGGDPSPSNVRAINGVTKLNVKRSRANLCGGESLMADAKRYLYNNTTYDEENNTFRFAAAAGNDNTGADCLIRGFMKVRFKPNTQYTFILTVACSSTSGRNIRIYYTDGTYDAIPAVGSGNANVKKTFVMVTTAGKTVYFIAKSNSGGYTTVYCDETGVFEGVLTADDFEPYNGNTYEIEFPSEAGTVYGGELTVNEDGTGTLTKTMDIVKVGDITWTKSGDYFRSNAKNSVIKANSPAYCSMYPVDFDSPISDGHIGVGLSAVSSSYDLMVRDSSRSSMTIAEWKTAFSDMEIVYTLQTPVVYQLTASQVRTLLGLNNIWADTGDISVEYHADPTIFVEEKTRAIKESIAPIEDGYTASQAYAVGSFLFVGDTLYKVTSAIASGATITPNTNCVATTVAEQLMALA